MSYEMDSTNTLFIVMFFAQCFVLYILWSFISNALGVFFIDSPKETVVVTQRRLRGG